MSAEAIGGVVVKWLWTPFIAWVMWRMKVADSDKKSLLDRVNNTYTKEEADERMDLKLKLMQQQLELLPVVVAKLENLTEKVSDIQTDVEVVKSRINTNNINNN